MLSQTSDILKGNSLDKEIYFLISIVWTIFDFEISSIDCEMSSIDCNTFLMSASFTCVEFVIIHR